MKEPPTGNWNCDEKWQHGISPKEIWEKTNKCVGHGPCSLDVGKYWDSPPAPYEVLRGPKDGGMLVSLHIAAGDCTDIQTFFSDSKPSKVVLTDSNFTPSFKELNELPFESVSTRILCCREPDVTGKFVIKDITKPISGKEETELNRHQACDSISTKVKAGQKVQCTAVTMQSKVNIRYTAMLKQIFDIGKSHSYPVEGYLQNAESSKAIAY
ncbi:Fc.00g073900.m01.CDS01 [Cosmosporella sp. VM-42]